MKKMIALILSLVLVFSITATVSADGEQTGSMILTAEIPAPSYTIHIPADFTLEYGNTGKQVIGTVYVTDVQNTNQVDAIITATDLINTDDSADTIALGLYAQYEHAQTLQPDSYLECEPRYAEILYWKNRPDYISPASFDDEGYCPTVLFAEVSDWSGATAGATYQSTVNFSFYTDD